MQRISVDLPVPDGPMIAVSPQLRDLKRDVAQHRLAGAVLLAELVDDKRPLPLAGVVGACAAVADTLMGRAG